MQDFLSYWLSIELEEAHQELADSETIIAAFASNLDEHLKFERGAVVLTNERIIYRLGRSAWKGIYLHETSRLSLSELAGVHRIELFHGDDLEASWRVTIGSSVAVREFEEAFENRKRGLVKVSASLSRSVGAVAPRLNGRPRGLFRSPLFRLFRFTRARMKAIVLGFVLTLTATGIGLIPPYMTMPLVDEVLVPTQARVGGQAAAAGSEGLVHRMADAIVGHATGMPRVAVYLGGLGVAAILAWLLTWGQGFVLARVSERISADLRNKTYEHLQRLSLEYFGDKRTGDLISRISNDTEHLCSFLSDTLVDFVTDVLMIVGSAIVLFTLDPWLAVATLASFPLIATLILRVRGKLTHGFLRTGRAWSAMTNILADTIPGVRVVKAFAQERREVERFAQANRRIFDINDRINRLWTFFWPLVGLLNQVGLLVVWAVGAWEVFHHQVTVGVLTAFIAYIGRFYARLESMSRMLTATQKASAGAQRLFEILDRVSSVSEPKTPKALPAVKGALKFEDISFRYGSRVVIDQVSFEVAAGEMVGIVGHTGSGKSSIANLACRFYDVSDGVIRLDDVDIRELTIDQYRRHIGIVLQDPFLFYGSIAENIAYGQPSAERRAIIEAARVACAHEFILRLPDGYDSLVGERGQALSGGERQRVAIARAVLIDPKILILDEATSAVDAQTEREIQRALDNVVQGRTTIAIAHRLSTLRKANKLIVLNQGRIVEVGTHAELLGKGGEYARLYRAQMQNSLGRETEESLGVTDLENTAAKSHPSWHAPDGDLSGLKLTNRGRGELGICVGTETRLAYPVRCFPLTHSAHFVALVDDRGCELALVESLQNLAEQQRSQIEAALREREFLPMITSIHRISVESAHSVWNISTDRGETQFALGHDDHVRPLSKERFVVTDTNGMRYLVNDIHNLDAKSQRLLSRYF
jgi:ATP-binding cassette, subfamily B, bacterial